MKNGRASWNMTTRVVICTFSVLVWTLQLQAQDGNTSFGWANFDGQTSKGPVTGGGNATPVKVTTFAQLKAAVESSDAKVIHVMNDVGNGYKGTSGDVLNFKSNKTIIGVKAGITVKCSFQISGVSNLIIRNIIIRGPGNSNSNQNWDAVCIQGSKRIWFDHCTVMEGEDGNFDVVKGSDNVTASWCKFTYVTGGSHNLSNLIGSSDNESISHGKLNVTYAYCWWDNVNSRCPRTRYGKIHVLNSYYNKVGSGAYAGFMSNVRVEGCYFESNVGSPTGLISTGGKAGVFTIDCNVNGTKTDGYNTVFTPPYQYKKYAYSEVKSMVTNSKTGAGATLENPLSSTAIFTLSASVAQGQGTVTPTSGTYSEGQNVTITATPAQGWLFDHWGGALSGSTNPATVTMNANKTISAHFIQDTRKFYSITKQAAPGGTITQSPEGSSLVEASNVTLTAVPSKGWTFSGWSGDHTGTNATWAIPSLSSNISVSASFLPVDKLVYQAENGILTEAVVETKNIGFTGEAYINFNATASSVEIPVFADAAGEKTVVITFANGSGTARALSVSVNGTQQTASLDFEATTDWTTWQPKQVKLTLPQGASVITLATINGQDGPNIDKIAFDQTTGTTTHGVKRTESVLSYNQLNKTISIQNMKTKNLKVNIFSLNGKKVFSREISASSRIGTMEIPLSGFNSGIYLIRLEYEGSVTTKYMNVL